MMKMALCFSHNLTEDQIRDARTNLGIEEFIAMPETLAAAWEQVSPEPDVPADTLTFTLAFLQQATSAGDYVLVQGEFGLTWAVVDWCSRNGRLPVYSTTRRDYSYDTAADGTVRNTHTFRHVRFRRYFNGEGEPV
ncbi:MAG: hypothetical protein JW832_06680 [Deltaproteobacteria bacterium]|nr:hypothetical protein [Deltaproteobacteria bacterium]